MRILRNLKKSVCNTNVTPKKNVGVTNVKCKMLFMCLVISIYILDVTPVTPVTPFYSYTREKYKKHYVFFPYTHLYQIIGVTGVTRGENIRKKEKKMEIEKKKTWVRNPQKNFGQEYIQDGDNTRFLLHSLEIREWGEIDRNDREQVAERIDKYFRHCAKDNLKPTVNGLAASMGISRKTLWAWKVGERKSAPLTVDLVIKAYDLMEEMWEHYMQNGKVNPVSGIFLAKNHFGYKDQQDIVVSPVDKNEGLSEDEIREKYLESAGTKKPAVKRVPKKR